ncbi:hypothetical protein VB774_11010 [Pseudanabaena galeata UHCC 0370]|uniref:Uncharacterized protein n=1 Tax=Pseudanabaena galeata UHCC 0370 TaxID=3110310 RepID=A0ABU5TJ09_9CYAN|nr:hypothetical protein [Pseudanabaena galeata]MEA5478144.1 hypothetical protein [Pseudanabaena galeata UHCC 0370]
MNFVTETISLTNSITGELTVKDVVIIKTVENLQKFIEGFEYRQHQFNYLLLDEIISNSYQEWKLYNQKENPRIYDFGILLNNVQYSYTNRCLGFELQMNYSIRDITLTNIETGKTTTGSACVVNTLPQLRYSIDGYAYGYHHVSFILLNESLSAEFNDWVKNTPKDDKHKYGFEVLLRHKKYSYTNKCLGFSLDLNPNGSSTYRYGSGQGFASLFRLLTGQNQKRNV